MTRLSRSVWMLLLLALFARVAMAQAQIEPPPPTAESTLSVHVKVVAVDALVHDRGGDLVRNLDKSAFLLKQDGKEQAIRYFSVDDDLPLTVGLLIDTSGSQQPFFVEESRSSAVFLRSLITKPQDRAFVVRFDSRVLMLQRFTSDQEKLQAALGNLSTEYATRGGTLLYDSVVFTAKQVMASETGRLALVMLTDGEDNGSKNTLQQAVQEAQRANIAVYTVLYSLDPLGYIHYSNGHMTGREAMDTISTATGGRLFAVNQDGTIEQIFADIQQDLRSQYRLGFTPPPSAPRKFHVLQLKVRTRKVKVQARSGYFTPVEMEAPAKTSSNP